VTSAAIEETVYRFGHLQAEAWAERGDQTARDSVSYPTACE